MKLRDSRRLTGPNILWDRPSAVIDVELDDTESVEDLAATWREQAKRFLEAVGWPAEELAHRTYRRAEGHGVSLALSAPIDALYAATEVNEHAYAAAEALLSDQPVADFDAAVAELRQTIADERKPAVLAMQEAARERGVAFLWDDDDVSVGMGKGSVCWPSDQVPAPSEVDWSAVHNIPVALVTGTNGKTTTVRLLASMVRAADLEPGLSSTDGCWVAGEEIGGGDYSGPGGARLVLRDPRVEIALLETARGGMLRRGLGVERADVAIITNVAEDHLGEWGVYDLDELVEAKFIVEKGTRHLVLNADDAKLRARHDHRGLRRLWFSLEHDPELVAGHVATGGETAFLSGRDMVLANAEGKKVVARLEDAPMTLGGAARHNIANALGAILVARRLGLSVDCIRRGMRTFDSSAEENPGRLNVFELGGVRAIVDFAHNPHGVAALLDMAQAMDAKRRLVLVGQAGDRDDDSIRELPRMVWQAAPDRVILKELLDNLRGREVGAVTTIMRDEFRRLGAPEEALEHAPSELAAVDQALRWAQPGDLLLLIAHEERTTILEDLSRLAKSGWKPGDALPSRDD